MDRAEVVLEDNLTCSFCLELLRVPKTLQCGHNFCGKCLQQYLNRQSQRDPDLKGVKCPQCREETPIPDPSKPVTEWANQFRTNCAIHNVVEGLTKKVKKECGICQSEGDEVKSEYFCRTCDLGLCRTCHIVHKKIPVCLDHDVEPVISSSPQKYKSYNFKIHLNKSSNAKQRRQLCSRVKTEIRNKIESISKKASESLKEKEKQLTDHAYAIVDDIFDRVSAGYPSDRLQDGASAHPEDNFEDTPSDDKHEQLLLASVTLTSKVELFLNKKYDVTLAKILTDEDFKYEESLDDKQVGVLESFSDECKVVEIEQIHVRAGDEDDSSSHSSGSESDDEFSPVFETTIQTVTDDDDNNPWIRNILVMTSCDMETVIVTDFNNSCVKAFYEDEVMRESKSTSRLVLSGRPWGITELLNERIAVSCPEKKLICFIRVGPNLKKLSETRVSKEFYGLAVIDSLTLVASAPKEPSPGMYIIDFSGRILKTIVTDRNGRNMFESPYYIAMSTWGDILVAEEKSRKILFLTKEGVFRARRTSGECYRPSSLFGIACSSVGDVFLADRESSKIVWVRDGKDDNVFLCGEDGVNFPRCVCLYKQESMYVVEEGGAVKKFQLVDQ